MKLHERKKATERILVRYPHEKKGTQPKEQFWVHNLNPYYEWYQKSLYWKVVKKERIGG